MAEFVRKTAARPLLPGLFSDMLRKTKKENV